VTKTYPYSEENNPGSSSRKKPTIEETIRAIQTMQSEIVPSRVYYGLSDLSDQDVRQLDAVWKAIDEDRRRVIVTQLAEASETSFDLDYQALGHYVLNDASSLVRAAAIGLLWIDASIEYLDRLIQLAQNDTSIQVRAAATIEIGRFILLGEYEEIGESDAARAQDCVISLWLDHSVDNEVRRRALEAISNSSHEIVPSAIREAYESSIHLMKVSAVFAMGRSYDEMWGEVVLREMRNTDPEIRFEAARAAGELDLVEAIDILAQLAQGDDQDIREASIWALGEIGGGKALSALMALAEAAEEEGDEEAMEAIDEAIAYASLFDDLDFDFDKYDDFEDVDEDQQ
jgi:HEAT repeat protein